MRLGIIALLVLVGGSMAWADEAAPVAQPVPNPVPLPRPKPHMPPAWAAPMSFRDAAGPDFNADAVTSEPSACRQRLEKFAVVTPMPRLIGPGACGGGDMIELSAVLLPGNAQVAVRPAPLLRCSMAESVATWVRDEAAPRVAKTGAVLRQVDTYDDYNCRGRNRIKGAQMSEHGKGNAVDVRSFTFADGRVVFMTDVHVPEDFRAGIRESVCSRFTTVLGPGSDGYHEEHIHLDLAERRNGFRMCQWDVREPPPAPLPKEEEEAAAAEMAGKPSPNPALAADRAGPARRKP
jgi:hypothetical protein